MRWATLLGPERKGRVRRKLLPSRLNETLAWLCRYAVHNAGVSINLKKAGEATPHVRTSTSGSHVDNIRAVYGSTVAKELLEVNDEAQLLKGHWLQSPQDLIFNFFIIF